MSDGQGRDVPLAMDGSRWGSSTARRLPVLGRVDFAFPSAVVREAVVLGVSRWNSRRLQNYSQVFEGWRHSSPEPIPFHTEVTGVGVERSLP